MKRLILLIITAICLASCSTLYPREVKKQVMVIDFRPYSEAGFFLSPSDYPGEYMPVGMLNMVIDPAVVKFKIESDTFEDSIYQSSFPEMAEKPLSSQELIDMAVHEAAIRGANGIANFKIEVTTHDYAYRKGDFAALTMPVTRYVISGFLIRILPKNNDHED